MPHREGPGDTSSVEDVGTRQPPRLLPGREAVQADRAALLQATIQAVHATERLHRPRHARHSPGRLAATPAFPLPMSAPSLRDLVEEGARGGVGAARGAEDLLLVVNRKPDLFTPRRARGGRIVRHRHGGECVYDVLARRATSHHGQAQCGWRLHHGAAHAEPPAVRGGRLHGSHGRIRRGAASDADHLSVSSGARAFAGAAPDCHQSAR
mmetsp:Transcript_47439/g.133448  ORF Transcript_47439/g.133448 Transcript_47439/m.133448 type:complete len:210 (-) Transcript_47439:33-662(-)